MHGTPILSETGDHVPVYTVQNENGFFPTGNKDVVLLADCPLHNCQIYQLPNVATITPDAQTVTPPPTLLAQGSLLLRDPAPGTPKEVALVGECNGLVFYVTHDDVTLTLTPTEVVLICIPSMDCLYISLSAETEERCLTQVKDLFSTRTNMYHDDGGRTTIVDKQIESIRRRIGNTSLRHVDITNKNEEDDDDDDIQHIVSDDNLHQSIFQSSKWIKKQIVHLSEIGARQVEGHGDRLRTSLRQSSSNLSSSNSNVANDKGTTSDSTSVMEENKNHLNIHPVAVQSASHIRDFSKTVCKAAEHVSDSLSTFVGGAIASTIVEKPKDSENTRVARQLLRTSVIAYGEISDGVGEGFDILSRATKREATACVAVKYGDDAAELTRHTLGATNNFVKTALTCRRILNVKKVAKSSVKSAVKQSIVGKEQK